MKRIIIIISVFVTITLLYVFLLHNKEISVQKYSKNDPYKKNIVKSQFFQIDTQKDTVIEAKQGTKVVFQKDCFIDNKGKVIEGIVQFELAEALQLNDMIFSNLTTTSDRKLLKTGGMIYTQAVYKNKEVSINPDKLIYIEVPTNDFDSSMMKYKGIRDEEGNMNWINPQPIENYLVTIDLDLLDFLPIGFEDEVRAYQAKNVTKNFVDSIYYSLPIFDEMKVIIERGIEVTRQSGYRGVNPRIIETIKSDEYSNTFIATREFESRMSTILASYDDKCINSYIENLDKNLWEIDEMLAKKNDSFPIVREYTDSKYSTNIEEIKYFNIIDTIGFVKSKSNEFKKFAKKKHTNVRYNVFTEQLQQFYKMKLVENQKKFEEIQREFKVKKEKDKAVLNELKKQYDELISERQKYRMEQYGFEQTEMGWINIDVGVDTKDWTMNEINVQIKNIDYKAQSNVYVIYSSINSLLRLESQDNVNFNINEVGLSDMPMYDNEKLVIICVASMGEKYFFSNQLVDTERIKNKEIIQLQLKGKTKEEIDIFLMNLKQNDSSNDIITDMELKIKIQKEQQKFVEYEEHMERLMKIAFYYYGGEQE